MFQSHLVCVFYSKFLYPGLSNFCKIHERKFCYCTLVPTEILSRQLETSDGVWLKKCFSLKAFPAVKLSLAWDNFLSIRTTNLVEPIFILYVSVMHWMIIVKQFYVSLQLFHNTCRIYQSNVLLAFQFSYSLLPLCIVLAMTVWTNNFPPNFQQNSKNMIKGLYHYFPDLKLCQGWTM